jgi:transcriptional regulator NrdR family protein
MLASNIPAYERTAEIEKEKYANLVTLLKKKDKSQQATIYRAVLESPDTIEKAFKKAICANDIVDDFDEGLSRIHDTFRDLNTFDDRKMQNISIDKSVGLQLLKKHLDVVAHVRDAGVYKDSFLFVIFH